MDSGLYLGEICSLPSRLDQAKGDIS